MTKTRVAVVGVGHFGRNHARIYAGMPDVELAWTIARHKYGDAPTSCVSCFQQCYAEPSLMQARPLE